MTNQCDGCLAGMELAPSYGFLVEWNGEGEILISLIHTASGKTKEWKLAPNGSDVLDRANRVREFMGSLTESLCDQTMKNVRS